MNFPFRHAVTEDEVIPDEIVYNKWDCNCNTGKDFDTHKEKIMRFRLDGSLLRLVDGFAMFFVMCLLGWAGAAVAEKGPDAFLPQTVYDFGTALEGSAVVHDFVIQNKGDEPLLIHRVRTG